MYIREMQAAVGEILWKNRCLGEGLSGHEASHYLIKSHGGIEKKFQEQLSRLRTDFIDYYLMHMLNDVKTWERLKGIGILEWIQEKKEKRPDPADRFFFSRKYRAVYRAAGCL